MAYYVQAEVRHGPTIYIGWFECDDLLTGKFEEGFKLVDMWPETVLIDKKGVDSTDLRSVADDSISKSFRSKLKQLK